MSHQQHPDRPLKPARMIPLAGDDNAAWHAWRNACDRCRHSDDRYGCVRLGVVELTNGSLHGLPRFPGGCDEWSPP